MRLYIQESFTGGSSWMINYTFIVDDFKIGGFVSDPLTVNDIQLLCKDFAYKIGHKGWLNIELKGEQHGRGNN